MANSIPSQVVQYIDNRLSDFFVNNRSSLPLIPNTVGRLSALLRLLDQLPNALLPRDPAEYAELIENQERIRYDVGRALNQESRAVYTHGPPQLEGKVILSIRRILGKCSDEMPPRQNRELLFIQDQDFRQALLTDVETCRTTLANHEWKASTVLAGSVAEALLLWAIQELPPRDVDVAAGTAVSNSKLSKNPNSDRTQWNLHELLEVAEVLGLVTKETASELRLAKGFRNLIHPGRQIRTGQSCDRGTALLANAAFEHVTRDLATKFPCRAGSASKG